LGYPSVHRCEASLGFRQRQPRSTLVRLATPRHMIAFMVQEESNG
jgi:hypothetical protein